LEVTLSWKVSLDTFALLVAFFLATGRSDEK
jgi:hypothetical protein